MTEEWNKQKTYNTIYQKETKEFGVAVNINNRVMDWL